MTLVNTWVAGVPESRDCRIADLVVFLRRMIRVGAPVC
jgi:hypothetical protein